MTTAAIRKKLYEKRKRANEVNELVRVIANTGRQFFRHKGRVARMEVDDRGRVWWVDAYSGKRIYTHYKYRWRGFTEGGTLRNLVNAFRDYVRTGERVPSGHFGPWPDWLGGGSLWGYSEADMKIVRDAALRITTVKALQPPDH